MKRCGKVRVQRGVEVSDGECKDEWVVEVRKCFFRECE